MTDPLIPPDSAPLRPRERAHVLDLTIVEWIVVTARFGAAQAFLGLIAYLIAVAVHGVVNS